MRCILCGLLSPICKCIKPWKPKFRLVYGSPTNHIVISEGSILSLAMKRKVSGDLVINSQGEVDKSTYWLFPWERENSACYARKAQREGWDW